VRKTADKLRVIDRFDGKYRFLSNFYPARVVLNLRVYDTVEHAYQAAKTLSKSERHTIRDAPTPGKAKRLGRRVTLRADWEDVKLEVMEELVRFKFREPRLKQLLLDTGDALLIEGNTWGDRFWGACIGSVEGLPRWNDGGGYIYGENWLGRILMAEREAWQ
jgi:ribA/ribD-fused uncharacterized protein